MAGERGASERRARRRAEAADAVPQPPWARWRNPLPPLALLDDDGLDRIEATAFRVLEELGLEFMSPEAVAILEKHGAKVVDRATGLVRMDRDLVKTYVAKAPAEFTLHARNPERNLISAATGSTSTRSAARPTSPISTAAAGPAPSPTNAT